jgi:threonine efflux protein
MIDTTVFLTLLGVHLLAAMSPGPDFFIVLKNSLQSRKIGLFTSLGITAGILVHLLYSFFGLALLIAKSVLIFTVIKYAGTMYLFYLAYKAFKAKKTNIESSKQRTFAATPLKAFKEGFITNVLNPKAAIYFVSLFSIIITPELTFQDSLFIGAIILSSTMAWFTVVTVGFSLKSIIHLYHKFETKIQKGFGVVLTMLGIKVLISE